MQSMMETICCLTPNSQKRAEAEERTMGYTKMRINEICEEGKFKSIKNQFNNFIYDFTFQEN